MPAGRPTKYSKQILKDTEIYLNSCNDVYEVIERPKIDNGILSGTEQFRKEKVKVPTMEGLAYHLKVNKDTIQEWRKIHKEFSVLIEELLDKQADMLINNGLSGNYSPVIAKVLLTKHGYREGIEQTGKDGKELIPDSSLKDKIDESISIYINGNKKDIGEE